jgi:hypothetical protein
VVGQNDVVTVAVLKRCSRCLQEFPATTEYFKPYKASASGLHTYCRECFKAYSRERERKPGNRSTDRNFYKNRVAPLKAYLDAIKLERGCVDCGYKGHPAALDFDHLPGATKAHELAKLVLWGNKEALDAEIAKCEVVCANCHRIRTLARKQYQGRPRKD